MLNRSCTQAFGARVIQPIQQSVGHNPQCQMTNNTKRPSFGPPCRPPGDGQVNLLHGFDTRPLESLFLVAATIILHEVSHLGVKYHDGLACLNFLFLHFITTRPRLL
ncbi:hypothetical protein ElyMa_002861700 [Elysia marginata]|uniref:WLM domain-containing protein n=1 Tax=Elysia marginata TaxID=1093978 RepID=A0AAV4I027_9GAST|nr:hypothetical protein ElyMa_002861700 [Elysia marginata]